VDLGRRGGHAARSLTRITVDDTSEAGEKRSAIARIYGRHDELVWNKWPLSGLWVISAPILIT
jgi:hypothetical protein